MENVGIIEAEKFVCSRTNNKTNDYYVFRKQDAEFVLKINKGDIKEMEIMINKIKGEK